MADETKKKEKKKTKNEMDFPPIELVIDGNKMSISGGNKKFRKNLKASKLEQDLDKQGYKGTPEKQSNSKVNPIDNANRIRAGLKKGGRAGYKSGKSVKKKGGCAIKGKSPILR
jgi:hypothetical protein